MNREMANGLGIEEFPFNRIHLVHQKDGLLGSSIKLFMNSYRRAEFTNMEENEAQSLKKVLAHRTRPRFDEIGELGAWDEFEQLEAKYDNGIISNEEFADGKRKLLYEFEQQSRRLARVKR